MYPIYGGVGAVNVTTHDKKLAELARRLLEEIKWHGPAQVEFKFDERDKTYKLIELNPKLWGTLDLSIRVGFNFPAMIRDILLGERFIPPDHYPEGVRYKFIFPQAANAYCQMIKKFGLKSIFDPIKYPKTYYDLDNKDLIYDLSSAIGTLRGILSGSIISPNANLHPTMINRIR